MVAPFTIAAKWPTGSGGARDPIDASFCDLRIGINGVNVTAYQTEAGSQENSIEIPSYYLAEWIAENWWTILWEPCKSEDSGNDPEFLSRHSLATVQHGFALPSVSIVPVGEQIRLHASERKAQYADARFTNRAEAFARRDDVESELRNFVEEVVAHTGASGGSPLRDAWALIQNTDASAVEFCRLIGALGLSPYEAHPSIERALDSVSAILEGKQLLDLCLTSSPEDFVRSAYVAGLMHSALKKASEIDLSALSALAPPKDQNVGPAWRYGYQAARELRSSLSVGEKDIDGSSAVFDKLQIEPGSQQTRDFRGIESPLSGGVERSKNSGRMVLSQDGKPSRRFAAGRAAFFFWTGQENDCRLITDAVTRDQQASRAFAAELLVPQAFLREEAEGNRLRWDRVHNIAEQAVVAPELIKYQALNCGLQVV